MAFPSLPPLKGQKVLVPVVAAVVVLGGVFAFMGQSQQLAQVRQQLAQSQKQLADLDRMNQELGQQLDGLSKDRQDLEQRLTSLRNQFSTAASDLERSRGELKEFQEKFQRLSEERVVLQAQLDGVTGERDDAKKRLSRVEEENSELERSVSRLRERLALLDRDYREMAGKLSEVESRPYPGLSVASSSGPATAAGSRSGAEGTGAAAVMQSVIAGAVELPPIIVRKDQAGMSVPVRGRVVEVNEPHNFIVIDQGSQDGVVVGMVVDVIRGGSTVGRATVVRVRPQLSAGELIRQKTPGPVQAGDVVVQSGS